MAVEPLDTGPDELEELGVQVSNGLYSVAAALHAIADVLRDELQMMRLAIGPPPPPPPPARRRRRRKVKP